MGFIKIVKNKSYFKRYQVKYRRRRECKTDYKARRAMITQDKTKYGAPKYRMVVRFTNKDVICQIVHPKVSGDDILCSAYSHELPQYGIPVGLKNYAAAYATGLLLARRTLTKLNLADKVIIPTEAKGDFQEVTMKAEFAERRPFKAILDVGLRRTTTGARLFGALKGAVDGGLDIPHKPSRFPGYSNDKLNAAVHREHILGQHIADYFKQIKELDADERGNQFTHFDKHGLTPEKVVAMYTAAHKAIRENPLKKRACSQKANERKDFSKKKLTRAERKVIATKKVASLRERLGK